MRTGTLISPSHRLSLPPRPLFAAFFHAGGSGLLRRVAVWGFPRRQSCLRRRVQRSRSCTHLPGRLHLLTIPRRCAPATARVPRGRHHAAHNRIRPCQHRVSLSGAQAFALRINASSHLPTVCAMLWPIMLMPSPAPNPAVERDAGQATALRPVRLARRPSLPR